MNEVLIMENILKSSIDYTVYHNNKSGLEYFDNYKMKKEKRNLINSMLQSDNQTDVEFATVYEIDDHYTSKRISSDQALSAYNEIKSSSTEVETSIKLFKCYVYAEEQAYGLLDENLMGVQYALDSMSDEYIQEMYKVRFSMISIASLVAKNHIKEARELCEKVMNENFDNHYSTLVGLWYGNTFIQDNPDKAIAIYERALSLAIGERCELVRECLKDSLDFTNILIGYYPKHLKFESNEPSHVHNIAFWYIKSNECEKAEQLLNTINYEDLNDVQKGFHNYYRGYINEPMKHFAKALKHFKVGGEFYYRKLALYELRNLGLVENVIEALSV
jgi:tetratricopeptide (TPR) repeat protein